MCDAAAVPQPTGRRPCPIPSGSRRMARCGLAVQLAPSLGLAYLGLEPDLSQQLAAFPWAEDGTSMHLVRDMLDVVLFDVYPFQIIGPGHIERLGGVPNGAQSLTGGRFAVSC